MDLICDERLSDSPFIERIWHSRSEAADPFISMANHHYGLVVTKFKGGAILTVRGPETKATPAVNIPEADFLGIQFRTGVYMPNLPPQVIMDRRDVNLPEAGGESFWLNGSAWEFPTFENAEAFVNQLARDGSLVYDPIVKAVLQGQLLETSSRTVQRRFLQATGMPYNVIVQIERARYAAARLKEGVSILDAVYEAGYFDQAHLTRSLKTLIGLTPGQIMDPARPEKLSFLYNTGAPGQDRMALSIDKNGDNYRI